MTVKYIITKGNNSGVVKRVVDSRPWWVELPPTSLGYNFLWQPTSHGIRFDSISEPGVRQAVNHFEFHRELSKKSNMFVNLAEFAEVYLIRLHIMGVAKRRERVRFPSSDLLRRGRGHAHT